jgi:CRISPR-associated protein Cas5a/b/c
VQIQSGKLLQFERIDAYTPAMTKILDEIASQPECWRQAASRVSELGTALPRPGEKVAFVGCGTSLFVSQAVASFRERLGLGPSDAFPASEVPTTRTYDRVVAISRSGTTTEVVRVLDNVPDGTPTVVITAVPGSPVTELATDTVMLDFADEESVVQTRFATTTIALWLTHAGQDIEAAVSDSEEALRTPPQFDVADHDHYVFLGRGWTIGLANEAALKFRESAGAWTESYPAMEYRHGPISVATSRTVVWPLEPLDRDLVEAILRTGAHVVPDGLHPMARLVMMQRAAVALAQSRGLDPDLPRHLTRSVVLEAS